MYFTLLGWKFRLSSKCCRRDWFMGLHSGLMLPLLAQGENHKYDKSENMLVNRSIYIYIFLVQDNSMAVHCPQWTSDSLVSGAMSSADTSFCQNGTDIIWTCPANSQQKVSEPHLVWWLFYCLAIYLCFFTDRAMTFT